MSRDHLTDLVGQSLFFRHKGPTLSPEDRDAFRRMRPGGVIFFADNLESRKQARELTDELQALAHEEGLPPLLISADQEGGIVTRIPADMVTIPSAMALGPLPEEIIGAMARITAKQLLQIGINTNLAPTMDVNSNPANPVIATRSYGETPEIAARAGVATIAGFTDEGVVPCVKHFPGHGDTSVDSHFGLPVIDRSMEELRAVELVPFQAAIDSGVPMVMTAHIVFRVLDELPATLSRRILTGLLREEMGFKGVIITDSMSMDAISDRYGIERAAVMAKAAGADILESSELPVAMLARQQGLIKAVEDGELDIAVFERTAERVAQIRRQFGIGQLPPPGETDPALLTAVEDVATVAIRTADGSNITPLPDDPSTVVIAFDQLRAMEHVDRFNLPSVMDDAFRRHLPNVTVFTIPNNPGESDYSHARTLASQARTLVIMTRDAMRYAGQVDVGKALIAAAMNANRVVHVALRAPYDQGVLGDVHQTACTYGDAVVSLRGLARRLAGEKNESLQVRS